MVKELGATLKNAVNKASATATQAAGAVLKHAQELAKDGAAAVASGMKKIIDNDLASAAALKGISAIPGVGAPAAMLLGGARAIYSYALKGTDYVSPDPYQNKSLGGAAVTPCLEGTDERDRLGKEKLKRREKRNKLIKEGKKSPDENVRHAAERLERNMVGVERAMLSSHVYDHHNPDKQVDGQPPPPPIGYAVPNEDEMDALGVEPGDLADEQSGFRAQIYKVDPKVMPTPPDFVVAFRGTTGKEDWTQGNIPQGAGFESRYYTKAMQLGSNLSRKAAKSDPKIGFEFTGHSLGGGLASAASVVTGIKSTTQNAAGLHDKTTKRFDESKPLDKKAAAGLVDAYRIDDDDKTELLTSINKLPGVPDAVGTPIKLKAPAAGVSRYGLHGIGAVIDSIEDQKTEDQQILQPR